MAVKSIVDQMGNTVGFSFPPKRIVSLVPSQTELLADLQVGDGVVGITKFCVHPASWCQEKVIVGGTKNFWFDAIEALKPDLIIGNKEENYQQGINQLQEKYPVWMSDIITFDDSLDMIFSVGELTDTTDKAQSLVDKIRHSFADLKQVKSQSVLYLIWRNPWMAAGSETFINTMLETMGLTNCLQLMRYPELSSIELKALKPDLIFLSSEPYPFQEKHIAELQAISPTSKIMLVDGEILSWYGSRLQYAPAYINTLKLPLT